MRRAPRAARRFSYGNFRNQDPDSLVQGWETYDARPRFGTNWFGMRGRLSVLSEAYSNADFAPAGLGDVRLRPGAAERSRPRSGRRDPPWPRVRPARATRSRCAPRSGPPTLAGRDRRDHRAAGEGNGHVCPPASHRRLPHDPDAGVRPLHGRAPGSPGRRRICCRRPLEPACVELLRRRASRWCGGPARHGAGRRAIHGGQRIAGRQFEGHRPVRLEGHWRAGSTGEAAPAGLVSHRPATGSAGRVSPGAGLRGRRDHLEPARRRAAGGPCEYPILRSRTAAAARRSRSTTRRIRCSSPVNRPPPFTLTDATGRPGVAPATSPDEHVVLYFYPTDDTPGCTKEACGFRDAWDELQAARRGGARRLGGRCRFARSASLRSTGCPSRLLSDPEHAGHARPTAPTGEKTMYGRKTVGVIRSTVWIGPDGRVRRHWARVANAADASRQGSGGHPRGGLTPGISVIFHRPAHRTWHDRRYFRHVWHHRTDAGRRPAPLAPSSPGSGSGPSRSRSRSSSGSSCAPSWSRRSGSRPAAWRTPC